MKQLMFCYKVQGGLQIRYTILTDAFVPVEDIISPQKTTLTIVKTDKVKLNDIVIIRDNESGVVEYIGYIDTILTRDTTELSCYPLINLFDNDFVLDNQFSTGTNADGTTTDIPVDIVQWLATQITRAFISTDDSLQAFPFVIRRRVNAPVLYKNALDTANLFEAYVDAFIETGVYILMNEIKYSTGAGNVIEGIYCDIYSNREVSPYNLRWDNPTIQSIDITDNTFTNYNKIIATEEVPEGEIRDPQRFYFYLLNNNEVTTNPNDPRRIKQVRSKSISFSLASDASTEEGMTDEEKAESRAKALLLAVYNDLQAPEYNLKIDISMFKNDNLKLYRLVDFVAEDGTIYTSNVSKIEILNDKQIKVTFGALRNSLTDFKKKVEAI